MERLFPFVCLVTALGCRPGAGDASTASSAIPSNSVVEGQSTAEASSLAKPVDSALAAIAYDLEPGCASDVDESKPAREQLDELGRLCAPGLSDFLTLAESPERVPIERSVDGCIRIGIVSSEKQVGATVVLSDSEGQVLESVTSRTPLLAPRDAVLCVRAGRYEMRVSPLRAKAPLAVRVWEASAPGLGPAPTNSAK
ncbi:MAG TPA: hypothetical protein PLJ27_09695 [Polyangiaceae bacterium]|jgi:hypothetical protein|nr:MAG: hypothetical protein BWY17_03222 [Deltaproteobacteria bacterium ADurb.Bin207]HPB96299.1 hypothetical protein [Polyangiaceae bacterium]HQK17719.1 hypothetical protein [Polyangiaceae bacterium]HQM11035.1 hypothetical protein [Polyangiaceae bacterium]